ncbi:hypothetical protein N7492_009926 [Penicillium capsulatum]|uniref:Uncharacterized protein n=1 Tax=Penicillium capsulatum TaxID=69766 RepID=A0A9W9HLG3_9EURO|nr:hypothetical protein N7492_009926 [Penicillium capsulatum]KAJ6112437.1 hypothetical protein N7512_007761 [Penicillium capsulatum]
MRLAIRIGSAALLIIVSLLLLNRRYQAVAVPVPKSFWHFDTTTFRAAFNANPPKQDSSYRKWGVGTGQLVALDYKTTKIEVPNEGIIVMGKLRAEDTSWVSSELAEWRNMIYTVDDTTASTHTPKNKGREALPYLQFIVDHYEDLPAVVVFLHAHRDGWPAAWHADTMSYSNVESLRALRRDAVLAQGYVSLRCQLSPGCPAEMQPFRNPPKPGALGEPHYAAAYKEIFGNDKVPASIGAPCCSQFAVSRDQILQRPLSDYRRMYNWVLNNNLPDEVTSNIMEYSWHMIFGREPIFCPDTFKCYGDVYGEELIN